MSATEATKAQPAAERPSPADAELAVARMGEMSADLRGCAVLDGSGGVIAGSGGERRWAEAAGRFMAAVDGAGGAPAAAAHVATEDGEAFAVRHGQLAMVAVADRFTLASLMMSDMRTVLRDLAGGRGIPDRRKPHPRELHDAGNVEEEA
jgi:hypothetical protein